MRMYTTVCSRLCSQGKGTTQEWTDKRPDETTATLLYPHPITGFKDDSACVTTKTAVRITEDGLVVLNIIYMVYNIFHALTL